MKRVVLDIPEEQFDFFMQLMQSLNFVQIPDSKLVQGLSAEQQRTWQLMQEGLAEMQAVKQGKAKARPVQDLLDELTD